MVIDVFVSYHTATSLETARAVVEKLESRGLRCWYQERDSRGYYAEEIERVLRECGAFVVILHGYSRHVRNEVALAFKREDMELLPLRMTTEPLQHGLEYYLCGFHQIDGHSRSLDVALEDLCERTLQALRKADAPSGAADGIETLHYKDGSVYVGQVVNGKRHGRGRRIWESGAFYDGDWRDNKRHGKGRYIWPSGAVYEGDWRDDKRTGKGKYIWTNGTVYEGDWLNSKRTGKGKYTWPSGSNYEGDFLNGTFHGRGRKVLKNGIVYEGDFLDGKLSGCGTKTYASGRVESGRFQDNKFLG